MKNLIVVALIALGVYHFEKIENAYHGFILDRDIEQAYGNGNIPSMGEAQKLINRAMVEDLIASGRFTRSEANELIAENF